MRARACQGAGAGGAGGPVRPPLLPLPSVYKLYDLPTIGSYGHFMFSIMKVSLRANELFLKLNEYTFYIGNVSISKNITINFDL